MPNIETEKTIYSSSLSFSEIIIKCVCQTSNPNNFINSIIYHI